MKRLSPFVLLLLSWSPAHAQSPPAPSAAEVRSNCAITGKDGVASGGGGPRLALGYGKLPLSFEANQGQSDELVKFLARGQGYSLFLTPTEAVLSLRAPAQHKRSAAERDQPAQRDTVVRMRLVGANTQPEVTGLDPLPGKSNYFIGDDPARWQRDVPSYARVKYADVYPGIDLVYYGNQRQLEYDILVAPNADPGRIALAFEGVQKVSLDTEGNLVLQTSHGDIAQRKPVIYQYIGGKRQPVDGRYVLRAQRRVGFQVARYDTTRPLVIDPLLSYSTYLGGGGNDVGNAIAVDSAGNAYVTGVTTSINFPGASTSLIQPNWAGSDDVFVTKLNAAGNAVVYSTYLGGNGGDTGFAIAVDSTDNAYVTGETNSSGISPFPTVGAFQTTHRGGGDAVITKLNASGSALLYSTYLGGSGNERGYGIAVDGSDNAYVAGVTNSIQGAVPGPTDFPTFAAFQPQSGSLGNYDAFVTKINAAGSGLVYSTYLGGSASEYSIDGGAIAVDSDGNAYVGGTTASTNFPGVGASLIQSIYGGGTGGAGDGFVVKFNAAGSALVYSTYLGGSTYDAVNGIAIDTAGSAYVAGYTDSINFRTASPLYPDRNGSGNDAFVSKLNAAGSALVYSTYLGGSGAGDIAYSVAVNINGNAYVSGFTNSGNFPTVEPIQGVNVGLADAFVSELNAAGSALVYSTYLGGSTGAEHGYGIAVDGSGKAYVTGKTNSTNFPTAGTLQTTLAGGGNDAFVAKIVGVTQVPTNVVATATSTSSVAISWTGSGGASYYEVRARSYCCTGSQTTTNTSVIDSFAISGLSYLYDVRAYDSVTGLPTAFSPPDLATVVMFTDDPLVVSSTVVKATHITELRNGVNGVRALAKFFPAFTFTDGNLASLAIMKTHIEQLRAALSEGRAALSLPAVPATYTDAILTSGVSTIKAAHIEELRAGVK